MAKRRYQAGKGSLRGFVACRARFLQGKDTPRAYLERCIRRIRKRDGKLKAFAALDLDHARQEADRASMRYAAGATLSALDGCPLGVKDIIHTARMPTSMGTALYDGWQAPADATCVAALREAGAVVVGKTHTTEFAVGESAPTTNPWHGKRTPGGSSSGSAAAVGDGLLPLALGTQTMGSILRPASYCGAVGYKPTVGSISMDGIHPLSRTLDHVGPIAASVEDAWAAVMVMRHTGNEQRWSAGGDAVQAVAPARLARIDHLVGGDEREPGVQQAFDSFIERLQAAGVEVLRVDPDSPLAEELRRSGEVCTDLLRFEMRFPLSLYLDGEHALGPRIQDHLLRARALDLERYRICLAARAALRAAVSDYPAEGFLLPSASGPAPRGLAHTGARTMLAPWSAVGGPAWSLPLLAVDDLPLGVQLAGAPGRDLQLAATAHWMSQQHG